MTKFAVLVPPLYHSNIVVVTTEEPSKAIPVEARLLEATRNSDIELIKVCIYDCGIEFINNVQLTRYVKLLKIVMGCGLFRIVFPPVETAHSSECQLQGY